MITSSEWPLSGLRWIFVNKTLKRTTIKIFHDLAKTALLLQNSIIFRKFLVGQ